LGPVLAALMAKDPADRPSADEAARMLAEVQAGHTMGLTTVGPSAAPVRVPTQSVPLVDRSGGPEGAAEPVSKGSEDPTDPRPATAVTAVAGTVPPAVQHPAGGVPAAAQAHTAAGAPVAYSVAPARGPAGRRNRMKLVAIVLAVGVLAAGATFFVTRHLVGSPAADPTPTAQPDTAEPTDELATGTPTPGAPAPAGYRWVDDPAGFRFPLPTGNPAWQRILGTDNNQIFYSPDNKVRYLQFAVTVGQSVKPLDHMREMEVSVSKSLKDYKQHRMASTAVNGHEAAVWEFSYAAKEGGRRRAIETEFIDEDGTAYAIYSSSPDKGNDWTEAFQRFTTVLNGFTPTR
ncbi:hypothetical protein ACWCYO_39020, partial [Kitasatospora sp. NPDC001683]